jgi:uncharacterized membrane protein
MPFGGDRDEPRPVELVDSAKTRRLLMIVLTVLIVAIVIARVAGAAGVARLDSWAAAVRLGLAVMLLFTGSAHFTGMRHDLARMVPDAVPYPMAVITFTGLCEILGAIGLLVPGVRRAAGVALVVFFIAVLPANIHAARAGVTLRGEPATPLAVRIPMQLLFIGLTWWSAVSTRKRSGARAPVDIASPRSTY